MKKELSIDFVQICRDLIRGWWLIAISVIMFTGVGVVYTLDEGVDSYKAETSVFSVTYGQLESSYNGINVIHTYEGMITSRLIADKAATLLETKDLSGDVIKNMVSYEFPNNSSGTNMVLIYAQSTDPNTAIRVANAVAQAFAEQANSIMSGNSIQVLDEAEITEITNSVTTDKTKIRLLAAGIGFVLPCIYLVLTSIFTFRIKTVNAATPDERIKLIGVIPHKRDI